MQNALDKIIDDYLADFEIKKNLPYAVKNSLPVIWFGDISMYRKSPKRVITVAINPSLSEFTEVRFPAALSRLDKSNLCNSLNDYFNFNPYKKWFQRYESIINLAGATYGGKVSKLNAENFALNIDLLSPVATDPTWGKLTTRQKNLITNTDLFRELYTYLDPDLVFVSVDRKVAEKQFELKKKQKISSAESDKRLEVYKDGKRKIIFGRNMQGTVFGGAGMTINFIAATLSDLGI